MTDISDRFGLPLLQAGQAQKELFHNEALAAIDMLLFPDAVSLGDDVPPTAPAAGQCWIVGETPSADWSGRPGAIACWTQGGWRFVSPREGMAVWVADQGLWAYHCAGVWTAGEYPVAGLIIGGDRILGPRQAAIADPGAGTVIDSQARSAVSAILAVLRTHGLIAA